jgi:hypothetical protein
MDGQVLFNLIVSICGVFGGWILKMLYDGIRDLRTRDEAIDNRIFALQETYVRRDDFRDAMSDLKSVLVRIEAKIDHKVDKP